MPRTIRVATRGSALALAQSRWVVAELQSRCPHLSFDLQTYSTAGDATQEQGIPLSQAGGKGLFTRELDVALVGGQADMAVHSLKDVPTELPAGLILGCVPEREVAWDAVVTADGRSLEALPAGARVGTSSLRRLAQLRRYRPDLTYVPIRGNVDTRLRKLAAGEVGALVMAAAGLIRAGFAQQALCVLPPDICLPAAGQGALAVEIRADDAELAAALAQIHHPPTAVAVTAERAFLAAITGAVADGSEAAPADGSPSPTAAPATGAAGAAPPLGSSCQTPVAAFAEALRGQIHLRGLVSSLDGQNVVAWAGEGPEKSPVALGKAVAAAVLVRGGQAILERLHGPGA